LATKKCGALLLWRFRPWQVPKESTVAWLDVNFLEIRRRLGTIQITFVTGTTWVTRTGPSILAMLSCSRGGGAGAVKVTWMPEIPAKMNGIFKRDILKVVSALMNMDLLCAFKRFSLIPADPPSQGLFYSWFRRHMSEDKWEVCSYPFLPFRNASRCSRCSVP
jgi:hypothetical protein